MMNDGAGSGNESGDGRERCERCEQCERCGHSLFEHRFGRCSYSFPDADFVRVPCSCPAYVPSKEPERCAYIYGFGTGWTCDKYERYHPVGTFGENLHAFVPPKGGKP